MIEGVYPSRPPLREDFSPLNDEAVPVYVGGSEALGIIVEAGSDSGFKVGDKVVLDKAQSGIWATEVTLPAADVMKIDADLPDVAAATMRVSAPLSHAP